MVSLLKYLSFGLNFFYKSVVLRQRIPLMGGLVITDKCNLSCSHCHLTNNTEAQELSKDDVISALSLLYSRGSQFLAITGGEPMCWANSGWTLDDVIVKARKIGFKLISVYTNGTLTLKSGADVLFVSLDGVSETNNRLRDNSYKTVVENLSKTTHEHIVINATINSKNYKEINSLCLFAQNTPTVKAIFFYFHTPYYGIDELFIDESLRNKAIDEIISLKKQGYPIMNSVHCLKGIQKGKWQRPGTLCDVYAAGKIYHCCRANSNSVACNNCGYLGYAELEYIAKINIGTICNTIYYLPK